MKQTSANESMCVCLFVMVVLQTQLNETEGYITKLQTEKAEARAGLEKDAIERNVKLEVVLYNVKY